jgi:hypothetical protein
MYVVVEWLVRRKWYPVMFDEKVPQAQFIALADAPG